jgi:hypothetical protein
MTNPSKWSIDEKIAVLTNLVSVLVTIDSSPIMVNYFKQIKSEIDLPDSLYPIVEQHAPLGGIAYVGHIHAMDKEKKEKLAYWLRELISIDPNKEMNKMQQLFFEINFKSLNL